MSAKIVLPQFRCFPQTGPCWFDDRGYWQKRKGVIHGAIDDFGRRGERALLPFDSRLLAQLVTKNGGNCSWWASADDKWVLYYAHLSQNAAVDPASKILRWGFAVGLVGNSGNASSTRCHTHLAVYKATGIPVWDDCQGKVLNKGRAVDYASELIRSLKAEGRKKEASRCAKVQSKCSWCRTILGS